MRKALLAAAALAAALAGPAAAQAASPDAELAKLADDWFMADNAGQGLVEQGDGSFDQGDRFPEVTPAAQARRAALAKAALADLALFERRGLGPEAQGDAEVLRTLLEGVIGDIAFREYERPFDSDSNFWSYLARPVPLTDEGELRNYIARLRDLPRYFAEQEANARAGLARGFTVPAVTLKGRDASIAAYVVDDPLKSPFYRACPQPSLAMNAFTRDQLCAELRDVIGTAVTPAYARWLAFFREEYLPRAGNTLAAESLPGGKAYYAQQIRQYTTLDLTAEDIHRTGLAEVARITAEMERVKTAAGYKGTLEEFIAFLRSDPQFVAETPDELMGVASYTAKRVDDVIGRYFGLLPRKRFGIRPVAPTLAPFYTAGRGGLDACQMNTYDLPSRPLYNIPALTLHECAPGHSFQMALALEREAAPRFRREVYFSGFGEGWGLYTEFLGEEMGIYRTPYERFGRLSYEMWRAARLVIDTGIHHKGWSREQAVAYLAAHTALSTREVETEVDRYISWPGQALAYKLGEMTIRRLRAEAEAKLGARFDIRKFHDVVLALGSVPLPALERRIAAFIADGGQGLPGVAYD